MKDKFRELNERRSILMQECRDFAVQAVKPGLHPLPYEVWVDVKSEANGYKPECVGIVSVQRMEPYEYPYFLYVDTNGNVYKSEDMSEDSQWKVLESYMNVK